MSANLTTTTDLAASSVFRDLVLAAMTEHAAEVAVPNPSTVEDYLAARVVYDAESLVRPFIRLAADDQVISEAGKDDFDVEDIRRVVAEKWSMVAAAVPNLTA